MKFANNIEVANKTNNKITKGNIIMNSEFEKAILVSMVMASYKDKIIDEITYQNMMRKLHL